MHLIIDIGNTCTKCAIYNNQELIYNSIEEQLTKSFIDGLCKKIGPINKCIVSATGLLKDDIVVELENLIDQVLVFNHSTPLPFKTKYNTPATIGLDRLAAIAGAQLLYPNKNVLIIDTGTAITYDLLDKNSLHWGGNISPGLEMRFKALHNYTDKLPLINSEINKLNLLGLSTEEAIKFGVVNGILFELEGYIDKMAKNYKNLTVILTGGDAQFFANKLKKTIFVLRNLVSTGLNTILKYNVANN